MTPTGGPAPQDEQDEKGEARPREQLLALHAAYPSLPLLREGLTGGLERLAQLCEAARPHWDTTQPGREWTPAQELEHALIVHEGSSRLARLLASERPLPPLPREPGEYREGRRQAPASTWPQGGLTPEAMLARLQESRARVTVPAEDSGDRTAPHPFLGPLGAHDWLRMAAFHARHHAALLEEGLRALDEARG